MACISLPTAAAIAAVGSAVVGGVGAYESGQATKASDKFNAAIASENSTIAKTNAGWASAAGEEKAAMSEQKTRATVGAIKSNEAASGVDVNKGSPVDVRSSASELGELDAITIRSNAAREAYGYQVKSASEKAQSDLDIAGGENAATAGDINAVSTVLGGAGSAGSNYARYLQSNSGMNAGQ